MKRPFLLLSFLLIGLFVQAHPLKMSVTDIVHKDNKLYVKIKLFTDDLEMTLRTFCNNPQIDLVNVGYNKVTTSCLLKHINANLVVKWNGKAVALKFKKVTLSDTKEVTYVEMESAILPATKLGSVFVQNTLMFQNLPEQKSVVNMTSKEVTKTLIIEHEKEEKSKQIDW